MNRFLTILLLFTASIHLSAESARDGLLQSIHNATLTTGGDTTTLTRTDSSKPIELVFTNSQAIGVHYDQNQWWILPLSTSTTQIDANRSLWILPLDAASSDHSFHLAVNNGVLHATQTASGLTVTLQAAAATLAKSEARPHSDALGNRFSLQIPDGAELENAVAGFYWGTMLPSVVEKTMAARFPYSDGYVLSTLNVTSYAGSYPAVDHEFQIKGRLAIASPADYDIVRRMIALQFKLMADDPERLYRAPTSVQPDGRREYHVRRNSQDRRTNAAMFPLTGNIEVIEESSRYFAATKDDAWLRASIENLEHAAEWILASTDQYGRVWSDVYYEDQVMKDGRETEAQAFAARAFTLLADLEARLSRPTQAARFTTASQQMAKILIQPLPDGFWDPKNQRFIDWVDRDGKVHDHIHLLANQLPVAFGDATADQAAAVRRLVDANAAEFERFPTFLSADIAAYTRSEIGDGGPYDLCAAGRYWYWDAAFRATEHQNSVLLDQLKTVAAEAAKNNYFMDERYDMDHVYYIDGKPSHGAQKYYEYPNVFASVLIEKYLGLSIPADGDLSVTPHLAGPAEAPQSVEFDVPAYAVRYTVSDSGFTLVNLSNKSRRIQVDLSALTPAITHYKVTTRANTTTVPARTTLTLAPSEQAHWVTQP